jgi:hypothetical protein
VLWWSHKQQKMSSGSTSIVNVVFAFIAFAIAILIVGGNSLTILAIKRNQKLNSASNQFILGLAIADLIVSTAASIVFELMHRLLNLGGVCDALLCAQSLHSLRKKRNLPYVCPEMLVVTSASVRLLHCVHWPSHCNFYRQIHVCGSTIATQSVSHTQVYIKASIIFSCRYNDSICRRSWRFIAFIWVVSTAVATVPIYHNRRDLGSTTEQNCVSNLHLIRRAHDLLNAFYR